MLMTRAKAIGVAPWELAEQPTFWFDAIGAALEAEASVRKPKDRTTGEEGG